MLVSGDFGAGKSHLLAHLERRALARGFVCSRVAISKETPLCDLGKVFRSAIENGRMPDRRGRLMEELGLVTDWRSGAAADFLRWAESAAAGGLLSRMFPASLLVYERLNDIELNGRIESFWAGDRLKVSEIKSGLASIGQKQSGSFRASRAAELPPQRLRFALELIKCAGYKGWVVLLDGGKKDRDHVGPRLAKSRYAGIAALAKGGMRLLEQSCVPLNAPSEDDVNDTIDKLRKTYSEAYGWDAPRLAGKTGGAGVQPVCATRSGPRSTNGICCGCTPVPRRTPWSTSSMRRTMKTPTWNESPGTLSTRRAGGRCACCESCGPAPADEAAGVGASRQSGAPHNSSRPAYAEKCLKSPSRVINGVRLSMQLCAINVSARRARSRLARRRERVAAARTQKPERTSMTGRSPMTFATA